MVMGQDLQRVGFKDRSWLGYKTRSSELLLNYLWPSSSPHHHRYHRRAKLEVIISSDCTDSVFLDVISIDFSD